MKKLLSILLLFFTLTGVSMADKNILLLQCKDKFKEIGNHFVEINFKTKKAIVWEKNFLIANVDSNEIELEGKGQILKTWMFLNRNSGKYETNTEVMSGNDKGQIEFLSEGTCVKKEKAF